MRNEFFEIFFWFWLGCLLGNITTFIIKKKKRNKEIKK